MCLFNENNDVKVPTLTVESAIELGEALIDAGQGCERDEMPYGIVFVGDKAVALRIEDDDEMTFEVVVRP
jgi:hypothetical protein